LTSASGSPGLAARISTELRIVQLRAVGENDLLETPAGLPFLARARDKTVHDNAIFAALPRSKHSVGRKGTSDLLLKLGAKPLAEPGVKICELFYNKQP